MVAVMVSVMESQGLSSQVEWPHRSSGKLTKFLEVSESSGKECLSIPVGRTCEEFHLRELS